MRSLSAKVSPVDKPLGSAWADVILSDWVADEDFHPDDTNVDDDYVKCEFLDLRKPLLRQVWEANFRYLYPQMSCSQ